MRKIFEKNEYYLIMGKFTLNIYFLSFFIWTAGLKYSVWLGLVALLFKRKKEKLKFGSKWIGGLNIFVFFGTILTDLVNYKNEINFSSFDKYNIFLMYFVLINFIENKKEIKYYLKLISISFFISIFGTIPSIKILLENSNYRIHSFYDIMRFAHLLASYVPILLGLVFFCQKKYEKAIYLSLIVIATCLLIFTKTRGAIIAGFSGLSFFTFYLMFLEKKVKTVFVTLSIFVFTIFFLPDKYIDTLIYRFKNSSGSDTTRIKLWKGAFKGANNNPIFGVGFKGVHDELEEIFVENGDKIYLERVFGKYYGDVHNSFLALLIRHGYIIGGITIAYMLILPIFLFLNLFKIGKEYRYLYIGLVCSMISFLVSGLTDDVLSVKTGNIYVVSFTLAIIMFNQRRRVSVEKVQNITFDV